MISGFAAAESAWLQEFESSMKGRCSTNEISIYEKSMRLKWWPSSRQEQVEIPNRLA